MNITIYSKKPKGDISALARSIAAAINLAYRKRSGHDLLGIPSVVIIRAGVFSSRRTCHKPLDTLAVIDDLPSGILTFNPEIAAKVLARRFKRELGSVLVR